MTKEITLAALAPGECATVKHISPACGLYRRFLDIGLIEETTVTCLGQSPLGDPKAYLIRGAVIAVRKKDARYVSVKLQARDGCRPVAGVET